MTEAEVQTLLLQAGAIVVALITTIGAIVVALINGRITRLKRAILIHDKRWGAWADEVIAKLGKIPNGRAIIDSLPPRPRIRLDGYETDDTD